MGKIIIDEKLIDHLAQLSSIKILPIEKKKFRKQLQKTLDYVENLKKLKLKLRKKSKTRILYNSFFDDGNKNQRLLNFLTLKKYCHLQSNGFFQVKKIY